MDDNIVDIKFVMSGYEEGAEGVKKSIAGIESSSNAAKATLQRDIAAQKAIISGIEETLANLQQTQSSNKGFNLGDSVNMLSRDLDGAKSILAELESQLQQAGSGTRAFGEAAGKVAQETTKAKAGIENVGAAASKVAQETTKAKASVEELGATASKAGQETTKMFTETADASSNAKQQLQKNIADVKMHIEGLEAKIKSMQEKFGKMALGLAQNYPKMSISK
jgi:chromosome segregation ATPase